MTPSASATRSICLVLLLIMPATGVIAASGGDIQNVATVVTLAIFRSPDCGTCESVERPALDRLGGRLGVRLETKIYDIDNIENYKLLIRVERELKDDDNEFPIVIVGTKLLGGNTEVEKGLEQALKEAIAAGQTGLPEVVTKMAAAPPAPSGLRQVSGKPVYAAFFSQGGCQTCNRLLTAVKHLKKTYVSFDYKVYDTRDADSACLFEALCEKAGIPEKDRAKNPAVFMGDTVLLERGVTETAIENKVAFLLDKGTGKPWEDVSADDLSAARTRIVGRFKTLGPLTVVAAGLIDGINPCAFATIVFFVTYLATTGRGRRQILFVGLTFTAAVFATYFAVGLGALEAILKLRAYTAMSVAIDVIAGVGAAAFGAMSLWDYFKARRGQIEEMSLVLPDFLKRKIKVSISRQMRLRGILIGALAAGAIVSIFELACTGQVYLPTLALMTGDTGLRTRAITYLGLYNLMFVLPLLVILGMTSFGLTSERLGSVFRRNIAASKLALAVLFFGIGAVVLMNVWLP